MQSYDELLRENKELKLDNAQLRIAQGKWVTQRKRLHDALSDGLKNLGDAVHILTDSEYK